MFSLKPKPAQKYTVDTLGVTDTSWCAESNVRTLHGAWHTKHLVSACRSHKIIHQDGQEQVHQRCQRHKKIEPVPPAVLLYAEDQRGDTVGLHCTRLGWRVFSVKDRSGAFAGYVLLLSIDESDRGLCIVYLCGRRFVCFQSVVETAPSPRVSMVYHGELPTLVVFVVSPC